MGRLLRSLRLILCLAACCVQLHSLTQATLFAWLKACGEQFAVDARAGQPAVSGATHARLTYSRSKAHTRRPC